MSQIQLTESETVSENCRYRCKEQGIQYFRFNPKVEKVCLQFDTVEPDLMVTCVRWSSTVPFTDFSPILFPTIYFYHLAILAVTG